MLGAQDDETLRAGRSMLGAQDDKTLPEYTACNDSRRRTTVRNIITHE